MLEVAEEDRHLAEEEDQGAVEEGRHFVPVAEEDQVADEESELLEVRELVVDPLFDIHLRTKVLPVHPQGVGE